jgi:hypothetical protein
LLPKYGPLKVLQFRTPTPETERMFEASFNETLDRYRKHLSDLDSGRVELPNDNFDLGEVTGPGIYRMNDDAHAELLDKLAKQNFTGLTPELRAEFLQFYADLSAPNSTKRKEKRWQQVQADMQKLKSSPEAVHAAAMVPTP